VGNSLLTLELPTTMTLSPNAWTQISASGYAPLQATTAYFRCYAFGLLVDHVYLSPAPLIY
jgi:hypothetical protein